MAGSDWNLNSQKTLSSQDDLKEIIKFSDHQNFSLSIAYVPGVTDVFLTQEKYDYYCGLINNITDVRIFKFQDDGFGKVKLLEGKENVTSANGNIYSSTKA